MSRIPVQRIQRQIPEWAASDAALRKILLLCFPKLQKDLRVRKQAEKLLWIIYLAYRLCLSDREIGEDIGISQKAVTQRLHRVRVRVEKAAASTTESAV